MNFSLVYNNVNICFLLCFRSGPNYSSATVLSKNARNATTKPPKTTSSNIMTLSNSVSSGGSTHKHHKDGPHGDYLASMAKPYQSTDIWRVQQKHDNAMMQQHAMMQSNAHFSPIHKQPNNYQHPMPNNVHVQKQLSHPNHLGQGSPSKYQPYLHGSQTNVHLIGSKLSSHHGSQSNVLQAESLSSSDTLAKHSKTTGRRRSSVDPSLGQFGSSDFYF